MLRGRGFESQYWMHIFHICCTKNLTVCLKRPKINEKESGMAHFKKKNTAVKFEVLIMISVTIFGEIFATLAIFRAF